MKKPTRDILALLATLSVITLLTLIFNVYRLKDRPTIVLPEIDFWKKFEVLNGNNGSFNTTMSDADFEAVQKELRDFIGKEISLTGFYVPHFRSDSTLVVSRYPNANCFFCGQAGIESIAGVELMEFKAVDYRIDQMLLVNGTLQVNIEDSNRLVYTLSRASVTELGL